MIYLAIVFMAMFVGLLTYVILLEPFREALRHEQEDREALDGANKKKSLPERVGDAIERVVPLTRSDAHAYRDRLAGAGLDNLTPASWRGMVVSISGLFAVMAIAVLATLRVGVLWCACGAAAGVVLGWGLSQLWLSSRTEKYRREVEETLPNAIEMMRIVVSTGQTLQQSLEIVGRNESDLGAISRELRKVSRTSSTDLTGALRAMQARVKSPHIDSFVETIILAVREGMAIDEVLEAQAEAARREHFARLESQINKLDTKITIPLVGCFLPAVFVIVLGPLFSTVMESLGTMF